MSLSIACQDEPQGLFHRSCILFRQRPELADQESVIEGKELEANLARNTESGLPPAPDFHVTLPIATRRGDHRQDRLLMNPIEVFRRDDQRRPALGGQTIRKRKGDDDHIERVNLHFSPPDGRSTRYDCQDFVALACRARRTVQVRLRAPSGSRLVLTALSRTSPRHVVRNAGQRSRHASSSSGETHSLKISERPCR